MLFWHLFRHFIFSQRSGSLIRKISRLSMGAITLSVSAFLLILFVMNGMNNSISQRIMAMEPHLMISFPSDEKFEMIEKNNVNQFLEQQPDIHLYSFERQDVILRTIDGQFRGAVAQGVTEARLQYLLRQIRALGKHEGNASFWDLNEVPEEDEVFIGSDLARALGVFEGDSLAVISPEGLLLPPGEIPPFSRVKVKKLISTDVSDVDAQMIFYIRGRALKTLQKESSRTQGLEAWFDSSVNVDRLKKQISMEHPNLKAETWMDRNSALFFALKLEKIVIGLFLGIAALVAGCSVLTVLALLLSQKKKEVALLKVMGLSSSRTVKTFTLMGFVLSCFGILPGIVIGTGLSLYLEAHPLNILPDIYYDSQIFAKVDPIFVLLVLFVSLILAIVGAWIPAKSTNEIEMSQALRMKN